MWAAVFFAIASDYLFNISDIQTDLRKKNIFLLQNTLISMIILVQCHQFKIIHDET